MLKKQFRLVSMILMVKQHNMLTIAKQFKLNLFHNVVNECKVIFYGMKCFIERVDDWRMDELREKVDRKDSFKNTTDPQMSKGKGEQPYWYQNSISYEMHLREYGLTRDQEIERRSDAYENIHRNICF